MNLRLYIQKKKNWIKCRDGIHENRKIKSKNKTIYPKKANAKNKKAKWIHENLEIKK